VRRCDRWPFPANRFDCIATIATLHHLALEETLLAMKGRCGRGVLLVLDLFRAQGLVISWSRRWNAGEPGLRLLKRGRLREPAEIREAGGSTASMTAVSLCADTRGLCQAAARREGAPHLLWRYSIVWHKPA